MAVTSFSGVIVELSGDIVNPILWLTVMIFLKVLQRDPCYWLEYISPSLNKKNNSLDGDCKITISDFDKAVFNTPGICVKILNIF